MEIVNYLNSINPNLVIQLIPMVDKALDVYNKYENFYKMR